jgi:hypothetical protein
LQKLVDKCNQTHADIQANSLYVGQLDQQIPNILAAVVGNAPPDFSYFYIKLSMGDRVQFFQVTIEFLKISVR